jgi:hypothetical protein
MNLDELHANAVTVGRRDEEWTTLVAQIDREDAREGKKRNKKKSKHNREHPKVAADIVEWAAQNRVQRASERMSELFLGDVAGTRSCCTMPLLSAEEAAAQGEVHVEVIAGEDLVDALEQAEKDAETWDVAVDLMQRWMRFGEVLDNEDRKIPVDLLMWASGLTEESKKFLTELEEGGMA